MIKRDLYLREFKPKPMLKRPDNTPEKAKFPAIDIHNHLFGQIPASEMVRIMDEVGVDVFVNLSGNVTVPFDEQGYVLKKVDFQWFADNYMKLYPDRFAAFTMSDFAQWDDFTLIKDDKFAYRVIQHFEEDVSKGALGLKITKELGLKFTDASGRIVPVDDERLFPIWERAGELGKPVLIHVSDPVAFFLPVDETNEHYTTLQEFPGWSFYGSFYSKWELLEQRNRVIAAHPQTTFILPHVANNPEDLDSVAELLERFPNVYIDFSARIDELGRQPYTARDFFIKYQDRILFGTDMPISVDVYRAYYRFLETRDEYFEYPDYIGRWGYCRWGIYGLYLPDDVLRKVYCENAKRVIPGLP
ncbi:MAG: amidohydrolase family protein [Armatimonadota bacterium]